MICFFRLLPEIIHLRFWWVGNNYLLSFAIKGTFRDTGGRQVQNKQANQQTNQQINKKKTNLFFMLWIMNLLGLWDTELSSSSTGLSSSRQWPILPRTGEFEEPFPASQIQNHLPPPAPQAFSKKTESRNKWMTAGKQKIWDSNTQIIKHKLFFHFQIRSYC